jgi:hypothetical protein
MSENSNHSTDFESLKTLVETDFPTPIATVYRRTRLVRTDNQGEILQGLIDLFELFVKFQAIVALSELKTRAPSSLDRITQEGKSLEFLRRPSLGGWVGLLRAFGSDDTVSERCTFNAALAEWYSSPGSSAGNTALGGLREIGLQPTGKNKTPIPGVIDALVTFRNKQVAHGARSDTRDLKQQIGVIRSCLALLLSSAEHLRALKIIHIDRIQVAEDKKYIIDATRLEGTNPDPFDFRTVRELDLQEVYALKDELSEEDFSPVGLSPFLIWQHNEKTNASEAFVYNDYWKSKLEFLSYESGHFVHHKKLHRMFEDLLDLEGSDTFVEDEYAHLDDEERDLKAEDLQRRARVAVDHGRPEDAEELLERSLGYRVSARGFVELAHVQQAMGESDSLVLATLDRALELAPDDGEAISLRQSLSVENAELSTGGKGVDLSLRDTSNGDVYYPAPKTVYQAFVPARWRAYGGLVWIAIVVLWFIISTTIERHVGLEPVAVGGGGVMLAIVMRTVTYSRSSLEKARVPLSLQLSNMRQDRFDRWFSKQIETIFGSFPVGANGRIQWIQVVRTNIWTIAGCTVLVGVGITGGVLIGTVPEMSVLIRAKRIVDYLLFTVLGVVGIASSVGITKMVYDYGNLGLKPLVGSSGGEGLRAISGLFSVLSVVISSLFVLFFGILAQPFLDPKTNLDLFYLSIMLVFVLGYIGLVPFMLFRAAREAKRRTLRKYQEHVEDALNQFVRKPDEGALERYTWLTRNDKPVRKLRTWPMSVEQTLGMILLNLIVIGFSVAYAMVRLGHLTLPTFSLL